MNISVIEGLIPSDAGADKPDPPSLDSPLEALQQAQAELQPSAPDDPAVEDQAQEAAPAPVPAAQDPAGPDNLHPQGPENEPDQYAPAVSADGDPYAWALPEDLRSKWQQASIPIIDEELIQESQHDSSEPDQPQGEVTAEPEPQIKNHPAKPSEPNDQPDPAPPQEQPDGEQPFMSFVEAMSTVPPYVPDESEDQEQAETIDPPQEERSSRPPAKVEGSDAEPDLAVSDRGMDTDKHRRESQHGQDENPDRRV